MEVTLPDITTDTADETLAALRQQRERVRQFLARWRRSSESLSEQLVAQWEATANDFSARVESDAGQSEELKQRRAELAGQEQRLASLREEIEQREEQMRQQAREAHAELGQRIEQLQSLLGRLDEQEPLARREKRLDELDRKTSESRRQLARELKIQRKEQLAEIERRRIELEAIAAGEDAELENKLREFQDELSRLQKQTDQRAQQVEELRNQLESAQGRLEQRDAENQELMQRLEEIAAADNRRTADTAQMEAQLAEAREKAGSQQAASQAALAHAGQEQQQLREELAESQEQFREATDTIADLQSQAEKLCQRIEAAGSEASQQRIRELERERDALLERLAETEQYPAHSGGASQGELDELQGRYEMALKDVRELKLRNAKLEEQVSAGEGTPAALGDALDWEAQKRVLLAKLESDFDEDDPERSADRMTVEGAINLTDQVVVEKERELNELRRLLDEQSENLSGVAVGAVAIAEMLDGDELVKQEREKLETLQQEWREKLRKAEIDISVERAKIARERAQMEEKLQLLEEAASSCGQQGEADQPKRGKWLARLGLGEAE